jgi:ABC-type multidrug transport system ATPase subunit
MDEVLYADRVIVMDDGKIVMEGTPREIFTDVKKVKSYGLDVPSVTELAYELEQSGIPVTQGILTIEELKSELQRLKASGFHLP